MKECLYSEKELKKFLEDFYNVSGIIIGIHDFGKTDAAIQGNIDKKNFCRFCRSNSECLEKKCLEYDKNNFELVQKEKKVLIYECHMGFSEAIIPIIIDNEVICIIFMGQINCNKPSESDFEDKVKRIKQTDPGFFEKIDIDIVNTYYLQTTFCSKDKFKSYIAIAELCARSIYNNRWIKYRTLSFFEAFSQYVDDYITESLSINETAAILNISTSHLSRIIKKKTGMTFTEYVLREKVNQAKKLLTDTDMQIKSISLSIGIEDTNYFSRIFKKYTNTTCGEYRAEIKMKKNV
ncbi:MAG: transcriptional regulator, AraC family [Clostridia bacterium]|nr:transcriptional regulator, AraC family [Clostridia bacterium]